MKHLLLLFFALHLALVSCLAERKPDWSVSASQVDIADFLEIQMRIPSRSSANPFKEMKLKGRFLGPDRDTITVTGFCDAQDGSIFKLRFMPQKAGIYSYRVTFTGAGEQYQYQNLLSVNKGTRNGPLGIDPAHPAHFIYQNSGKHFFWNSTTTYWLLGWKDEAVIRQSLDRLAGYGINRIRVAINGRAHGGERWSEPTVVESKNFTFKLNPWPAEKPDDLDAPAFDVTRMNVLHWQKLDRLVGYCREKGIVVSLIFYVDGLDHGCDPFKKEHMGDANEQLYYAYAAARYSAYENIMWDIANEYHLFRTPEWADKMGRFLKESDPYHHLISVHGKADFPFRKSPWVDVVMYQSWDECGGYEFMTNAQRLQAQTGRVLPSVNEEYGYEGHYPPWGCGATAAKEKPDGRSGLNRSQLAWEICMTGSYQTTGETAEFGTGTGEDSGGGWINGRGNDRMTMLAYYRVMKDTFEKTAYWELTPDNTLVSAGNLCLGNPGKEYLIYARLPHCRVKLPQGQKYQVWMIDPLTGKQEQLPDADTDVDNGSWQYRRSLSSDRVFLLKRK